MYYVANTSSMSGFIDLAVRIIDEYEPPPPPPAEPEDTEPRPPPPPAGPVPYVPLPARQWLGDGRDDEDWPRAREPP